MAILVLPERTGIEDTAYVFTVSDEIYLFLVGANVSMAATPPRLAGG